MPVQAICPCLTADSFSKTAVKDLSTKILKQSLLKKKVIFKLEFELFMSKNTDLVVMLLNCGYTELFLLYTAVVG